MDIGTGKCTQIELFWNSVLLTRLTCYRLSPKYIGRLVQSLRYFYQSIGLAAASSNPSGTAISFIEMKRYRSYSYVSQVSQRP